MSSGCITLSPPVCHSHSLFSSTIFSAFFGYFRQENSRVGTEVLLFWIISAGGLCLNQIVMRVLVGSAGMDYMAAKGCSIVIVTVWNFFGKKKIVFYD